MNPRPVLTIQLVVGHTENTNALMFLKLIKRDGSEILPNKQTNIHIRLNVARPTTHLKGIMQQ